MASSREELEKIAAIACGMFSLLFMVKQAGRIAERNRRTALEELDDLQDVVQHLDRIAERTRKRPLNDDDRAHIELAKCELQRVLEERGRAV